MAEINTSDIRFLKNIVPLRSILDKIDELVFIQEDNLTSSVSNIQEVNVIAQQVQHIFPSMTSLIKHHIPTINKVVDHHLIGNVIFIRIDNTKYNIKKGNTLCISQKKRDMANGIMYTYNTKVSESDDYSIEIETWMNYDPNDIITILGECVPDYILCDKSKFGVVATAGVKELHQIVKSQQQTIQRQQQTIDSLLAWATTQGYSPST